MKYVRVVKEGQAYYMDVDDLMAIASTAQVHNRAVCKALRTVRWQSENESGERLAKARLDRADRQTAKRRKKLAAKTPKEESEDNMTEKVAKTPEKGTLAATLLERAKKNGKTVEKTETDLEAAIKEALFADKGRESVSYRDNLEVAVTEDGRLAIYVDISDAVEWTDTGYGLQVVSTRYQNPRTKKIKNYYLVTPSLGIRLHAVFYNSPQQVTDNPETIQHIFGQK